MTKPANLPFRQVHLDFHTSELIPDVGASFDTEQFRKALKLGRVNSITLFAKCHHSWSYYPTRIGRPHPNLKLDLLSRQIAAAHQIKVRCPIYYTVGWSANDAKDRPDWVVRTREGQPHTMNHDLTAAPADPKPAVSWIFLCYGNPEYQKLILDQTEEICRLFPVDGLFYDICNLQMCWCEHCFAAMKQAGLDPARDADVRQFSIEKARLFMTRCHEVIHRYHPAATIFFNGLTKIDTPGSLLALQTHFELEDLPTTWGGYDKFPPRARRFAPHRKPLVAMSGKFHTQWGEFGGFKHPEAIRFEAASMLAFGAGCSFGDQLHPSGEMDLQTYRNIGHAYRYVERIEEFARDSVPCANLALLLCGQHAHDQGVASMLLETQTDFEVPEPEADLSKYETVILPGGRFLSATAADRLNQYIHAGGSLLVLGQSAFATDTDHLLLDLGVKYAGPATFDIDYLLPGRELRKHLPSGQSPFLNYSPAPRFVPTTAKVLARIREPWFSRTYAQYCSHMNTPPRPDDADHAGAFQHSQVIFLPHALAAMYHDLGARVHRDFFVNALRRLYHRPVFQTRLPSAGRISFMHQPQHLRYVAHLLYSPPLQRGRCSVIEDFPPIGPTPIEARLRQKIKRIRLPLLNKRLAFKQAAGRLRVIVPEIKTHALVTFEY